MLGLGAAVLFYVWSRKDLDSQRTPKRENNEITNGFHECAARDGITFRMAFLPGEQGKNFKINLYDHGAGVAVGDYDGDGFDDIYFLNQLGPNALYRNQGDGTFVDVTKTAGVELGDRVCVGATFADYDNDGDQDLYVTSTRGGNVLFRNEGNGTFTNFTIDAGLELVAHSQTAAFFDADNDGYLDLIVTNTAKWTLEEFNSKERYYVGPSDFFELARSAREPNKFYRNNRNGTFTDVTQTVGLEGLGWSGDVAVFDYNHDGYLDLVITHMFGATQLYRNQEGKSFSDVTKEVFGRTSWGAIGCKAFDSNNDGRLDLYVVDMHSDMWMQADLDLSQPKLPFDPQKRYGHVTGDHHGKSADALAVEKRFEHLFQFRPQDFLFGNSFYQQTSLGKFEEVAEKVKLETFWPWGIGTGDFDNNGYEDVFLPSGMGFPFSYWPCALLMNDEGMFADRAIELGIDPPPGGPYLEKSIANEQAARSSRCAAVADFDGDGRLDLITNNFNDHPYYFRNHLPRKNYAAFRLTGVKCNKDAIGARVTLHFADKSLMTRQVHAAGGYLSHSSKTLHFGLGERTKIERAEIHWPGGKVQTLSDPAINQLHRVTQS